MNLLVGLFAVASLIWLVPIVQRGHLLLVALLTLLVGTLFGPFFFAIEGSIQFSLDRILWLGMIVLTIAGWRFGYTSFPALTRIDWVLAAMVLWFLLSCFRTSPAPHDHPPEARWLFYLAMPAGMYVMARVISIRSFDLRWLSRFLIGLGLYLSITALLEVAGLHAFVFPRYIVDPEVWEFYGRGRGPLLNPAGNGMLIIIAVTACGVELLQSGRRGKLLLAVAIVIMFAGLYATLTRSVWLGGIGALALVAVVQAPRWVRVLGLAIVMLFAAASVFGVKDQLMRMKRDRNLTAADAERSVKLRPLLAVVAWEMFKDRPLTGHGFGRYDESKHRFHTNRSYGLPLEEARDYVQHNVFLSVLVDTGMVGFGLLFTWLVMLGGVAWTMARNTRAGADTRFIGLLMLGTLAAYVANGMFHDVLIIPMVHMFLFFLAGCAVTVFQSGVASAEQSMPVGQPVGARASLQSCANSPT